MEYYSGKVPTEQVLPAGKAIGASSSTSSPIHAAPELIGVNNGPATQNPRADIEEIEESEQGWFAYFRTRNFYIVLVLGYAACTSRWASVAESQ